jgi:diguanylate cyclase (GGDEF)-like protein
MPDTNHILIVDDNFTLSENLGMILEAEGYKTTRVLNGQTALETLSLQNFQVILLDNHLPDGLGIEYIPRFHQIQPDLPVIVITAFASVETAIDALRLGADGFLLKPMDIDELLRTVARATEKYRLQRKEQELTTQLKALNQAAVAITAELDLSRLLQLIVDLARELINTSYGAIGVVDNNGKLIHLVTSGLNKAQQQAIVFPIPEDSLLGRLINYRKPMRLNNVDNLPMGTGFLPNFPRVTNLLGVPMLAREGFLGNLFLTNKISPPHQKSPEVFTQDDLQLIETLAAQAAVAIEKARLFQTVQQLSITDPLTGLFNRRHFDHQFELEFHRAKRYQRPLVVFMIDLDGLKSINDQYGHAAGDQLLVFFSRQLASLIRKTDLAARYGGDEYAVILTETGMDGGLIVANKIKDALEFASIEFGTTSLHITASLGVAALVEHISPAELLRQADQALYLAKEQGKNQVCYLPAE